MIKQTNNNSDRRTKQDTYAHHLSSSCACLRARAEPVVTPRALARSRRDVEWNREDTRCFSTCFVAVHIIRPFRWLTAAFHPLTLFDLKCQKKWRICSPPLPHFTYGWWLWTQMYKTIFFKLQHMHSHSLMQSLSLRCDLHKDKHANSGWRIGRLDTVN